MLHKWVCFLTPRLPSFTLCWKPPADSVCVTNTLTTQGTKGWAGTGGARYA